MDALLEGALLPGGCVAVPATLSGEWDESFLVEGLVEDFTAAEDPDLARFPVAGAEDLVALTLALLFVGLADFFDFTISPCDRLRRGMRLFLAANRATTWIPGKKLRNINKVLLEVKDFFLHGKNGFRR